MFEAISRAYIKAVETDEEKLKQRISKRQVQGTKKDGEDGEAEEGEEGDKVIEQAQGGDEEVEPRRSSDLEEDDEELIEDHEKWEPESVVLLHMIAFVVGFSNCWRFPYLCYTYGGLAFFIPYFIFFFLCAYPFAYLELLVGQIAQVGHIACWKLVPLFKGVGYCMTLLTYMDCFNIQTALAWSLFYMFQSAFFHPLPWISCDNGYGRKANGQIDETMMRWIPDVEGTLKDEDNQNWHTENCTEFYADAGTDRTLKANERLPGSEYFRGRVQRMWKSGYADENYNQDKDNFNGLEQFGLDKDNGNGVLDLNLDTIVCLILCFFMLIGCMSRGIKLNSKALLIAITVPYIVMALLFFRASGLNGAWSGVELLLQPRFEKLLDSETWWRAAEQVIYSSGCGYGVLITFGSHNQVNRVVLTDVTIVLALNCLSSVILAMIFFMFLGHVQVAVNRDIQTFVVPGPGLTFEVMADVLGVLAKSNFYAFCFYFMVFLLGFTTCLANLTFSKGALMEVLPVSLKYRARTRMLILALILIFGFVISSLNLNRGGLHTFHFLAIFVGSFSSHACNMVFLIGIAWVWGLRDLTESARNMGIRQPGIFFQICWKFIAIIAFVIIFFGHMLEQANQQLVFDNQEIEVTSAMRIFGLVLSTSPFAAVILGGLHALYTSRGKTFKQKFLISISPTKEHREILQTGTGKRATWSHYCYCYAPVETGPSCVCCYNWKRKGNKVTPSGEAGDGNLKAVSTKGTKVDLEQVVATKPGEEETLSQQQLTSPPISEPAAKKETQ